jgi:hypothetical protein
MEQKLLANRIQLLQTEEARLLRKIDHTRRKAEQIVLIKRANEERHQAEVRAQEQEEARRRQQQVQVLQQRMQSKLEQERRARSRMDELREGAQEVKGQRQVILELKGHMRQREVQENKLKMEEIRS